MIDTPTARNGGILPSSKDCRDQHADGDIHRYVLQVVSPCVCNREIAGRQAEAILDRHRLFDAPACKI
jgi:hypothetical protein